MPHSLEGRLALIVGGAGGIGTEISRLFAGAGARVVITHMPGLTETAAAVVASLPGSGHAALPADVAVTPSLLALRQAVQERYGQALHVLVNAAGFTKPVPHADLDALNDELIDRMFAVNWRGQFATIRTFAPMLKASGDGLVVSISSIAANTGVGSSIAYCAAKAGIEVMTKSLGRALAPEVRVMSVAPGVVDTAFVPGRGSDFNTKTAASTPLRRIGSAEDIAEAVLACATTLRFSTGSTVVVDGGRSL
ncbi:MAG TPA: SDR family oxidoreductase [Roseiarcus sp.]|jgi:3-oxoacyl-[acyl-carrier protein] reductase